MNCPNDIADIVLLILRAGVVSARNSENVERANLEADHVHNLPDLLMQYDPEKLIYYWDIERTSYRKQLRRLMGEEPIMFAEEWQHLEQLIPQVRASLPEKSRFYSAMDKIISNAVARFKAQKRE